MESLLGAGFDSRSQGGSTFENRTQGGFDSNQPAPGFDGGQGSDRSGSRITQRDRTTGRQPAESRIPARPANDFPQDSYQQDSNNKVVNIQATAQLQVVLVKPEVFTDAKQIADHLIAKKTVVLNLETASAENKRRIIDFLVGVAYANGGSLKPVANLTYIITPYNVGFIGEDLVNELETNGVIM